MMRAYLKMALAMLLVGSYLVVSKAILDYVPLFTAALARQLFACVALGAYLLHGRQRLPILQRQDIWLLVLQSFVGIFLYSVFSLYGVRLTSGISANIIMAATPAGVAAVGLLLLRERISGGTFACLVLALMGTLATHWGDGGAASGDSLGGCLLLILAVLAEAVFMTFGKLQSTPLPPIMLSFLLTALGALMFLPFALAELPSWKAAAVPPHTWLLLIYSGVVITALAVVLMNSAMLTVPTGSAAVFTALIPLSGVALSMLLLGEVLQLRHAIAATLILLAMAGIVFQPVLNRQAARAGIFSSRGK